MSHARIKILLCLYNSNKPETKTEVPRVDTSSHDVENSTPPSDCSLLGLMEPAHVENSPRDNVEVPPHPGKIGSHPRIRNLSISLQLTPTTWGRKRGSPGSISPRMVWKPQPHWLVANWLGLNEPAGGETCPSGQGRGRAAHGEVKVPSPDQNPSISLQFQQTRHQDGDPTGRHRPTRCGNPNSGYAIVDWVS